MPPHQGIKARWGDPKLGGDRIAVELVASLLYPIDRFLYPAHDLFLALRLATAAAALSDALQQLYHTSRALSRIGACASLSLPPKLVLQRRLVDPLEVEARDGTAKLVKRQGLPVPIIWPSCDDTAKRMSEGCVSRFGIL